MDEMDLGLPTDHPDGTFLVHRYLGGIPPTFDQFVDAQVQILGAFFQRNQPTTLASALANDREMRLTIPSSVSLDLGDFMAELSRIATAMAATRLFIPRITRATVQSPSQIGETQEVAFGADDERLTDAEDHLLWYAMERRANGVSTRTGLFRISDTGLADLVVTDQSIRLFNGILP